MANKLSEINQLRQMIMKNVIMKYKNAGFVFLSLDQLYAIISGKNSIEKPFVCFTMDDGYLDNIPNIGSFERFKIVSVN